MCDPEPAVGPTASLRGCEIGPIKTREGLRIHLSAKQTKTTREHLGILRAKGVRTAPQSFLRKLDP